MHKILQFRLQKISDLWKIDLEKISSEMGSLPTKKMSVRINIILPYHMLQTLK